MRPSTFLRTESYPRHTTAQASRRTPRSVKDIVAEILREPSHSRHVRVPRGPVLVQGMDASEAMALVLDLAERARDRLGRRIKRDAVVISVTIASCPLSCEALEARSDGDAFLEAWLRVNTEWLTGRYGDDLLAVYLHLDESHPHVHALIRPRLAPHTTPDGKHVLLLDFSIADPVRAERDRVVAEAGRQRIDGIKKRANAAARAAGAGLQQAYWAAVGPALGLRPPSGTRATHLDRQSALVERRAREMTEPLRQRVADLERENRQLSGTLVKLVAKVQTETVVGQRRGRLDGEERNDPAMVAAAAARVGSVFRPRRLMPDGVEVVGGQPMGPGEPLRPASREVHLAAGAVAATARVGALLHDAAAEAEGLRSRLRDALNALRQTEEAKGRLKQAREAATAALVEARAESERLSTELARERESGVGAAAIAAEAEAEAEMANRLVGRRDQELEELRRRLAEALEEAVAAREELRGTQAEMEAIRPTAASTGSLIQREEQRRQSVQARVAAVEAELQARPGVGGLDDARRDEAAERLRRQDLEQEVQALHMQLSRRAESDATGAVPAVPSMHWDPTIAAAMGQATNGESRDEGRDAPLAHVGLLPVALSGLRYALRHQQPPADHVPPPGTREHVAFRRGFKAGQGLWGSAGHPDPSVLAADVLRALSTDSFFLALPIAQSERDAARLAVNDDVLLRRDAPQRTGITKGRQQTAAQATHVGAAHGR